jgi:hypothetical protein
MEECDDNIQILKMIGTPNGGAPLSYCDVFCLPAANDLEFGSDATNAEYN